VSGLESACNAAGFNGKRRATLPVVVEQRRSALGDGRVCHPDGPRTALSTSGNR
jgi:hypothetical protein